MSDRGRSRRTARSTKATAPKAAPTPPGEEAATDDVTPEEQPAAAADVSNTSDISDTSDGADADTDSGPAAEPSAAADAADTDAAADADAAGAARDADTADAARVAAADAARDADAAGDADAADAARVADTDAADADAARDADAAGAAGGHADEEAGATPVKSTSKAKPPAKATVTRLGAVKKADDGDEADVDIDLDAESDADADSDDDADDDGRKKSSKDRGKTAAPLTKAEIRSAARIAAAKAARRRKVGQAIAGTLILVIAVGGAFAGIWYFGDRAEKNRIKCKPLNAAAFPPLLGGMDKRLATEPQITAGDLKNPKAELKKVEKKLLVEGDCKTVKPGQTITVNYIGATYADGKVFDSSWAGKKTFDVAVGQKKIGQRAQVIEGWDDSLHGMKVGTRVQLDIPEDKAYGEEPPQGAPVGALRFIVDILDVKDSEPAGQVPFG